MLRGRGCAMRLTQYEITHMENLMVRNDYWNDNYGVPEDDEEDP